MKTRFILFRVIGILLMIGLVAGGLFAAYRFGYAQGVAQSPAIAQALSQGLKDGSQAPFFQRGFDGPRMYEYGYPMRMEPHGFFPFGGLLGFLFVAFLFFGLMRFIFRPHWDWRGGPWHGYPGREWGGPPWAQEGPKEGSANSPTNTEEPKG